MGEYLNNIAWVEEYVRNVTPYIHVREHDALLIKIPNQAYKLNRTALNILKRLQAGESIAAILAPYRDQETVARDIHWFFCDLRAALKGCLREGHANRAVEEVRFTLGFNTLPVLSELALTYRCNLACAFCLSLIHI